MPCFSPFAIPQKPKVQHRYFSTMPSFASFLAHLPGLVQPDLLVVFLPMFFGTVALPWILSIENSGIRTVALMVALWATVTALKRVFEHKEQLESLWIFSGRCRTVESDVAFHSTAIQVPPLIATVIISWIYQDAKCSLGAKAGYAALVLVFGLLPGLYLVKCSTHFWNRPYTFRT